MIKIAPSLLSADFADLGNEVRQIEDLGAHYLHIDVMDGVFVPNISIGLPVLKSLRNESTITMDVHLMITRPHRYVGEFCDSGADIVNFHVEALEPQDTLEALKIIKSKGKKCGLTLKPKTPVGVIQPFIELLDIVLVMTVEPGFGGQSFMYDQLPKIEALRDMLQKKNPKCELEVDGGINKETAYLVKNAGATVLVAGSAVFGAEDRKKAMEDILNA